MEFDCKFSNVRATTNKNTKTKRKQTKQKQKIDRNNIKRKTNLWKRFALIEIVENNYGCVWLC